MRSSDRWAAALCCALLMGCPTADDDDDRPFGCQIGVWHEDGAWEPADGAPVELIFGFQGFLWISTQLRSDLDGPDVANLRFSASIDDGAPFGGSQPNVALVEDGDARYSDEVQIRLSNDEGPEPFIGGVMALALRGTSGLRECTAEATVTLQDEDPCIHTDDEPICDDDDSAR